MEELLQHLNALNASNQPDNDSIFLDEKTISMLASVVLISDEGINLLENHRYLAERGFPVLPGEQDSFGWLSGYIQTPKGKILFG